MERHSRPVCALREQATQATPARSSRPAPASPPRLGRELETGTPAQRPAHGARQEGLAIAAGSAPAGRAARSAPACSPAAQHPTHRPPPPAAREGGGGRCGCHADRIARILIALNAALSEMKSGIVVVSYPAHMCHHKLTKTQAGDARGHPVPCGEELLQFRPQPTSRMCAALSRKRKQAGEPLLRQRGAILAPLKGLGNLDARPPLAVAVVTGRGSARRRGAACPPCAFAPGAARARLCRHWSRCAL